MQNIARLTNQQAAALAVVAGRAAKDNRSLRVCTGTDNRGLTFVMWDLGNTGWTPPYFGEQV